jgi:phage terminase large subunit
MPPQKNLAQQENPFVTLMRRYRNDPVAFAEEVIGITPDEWQVELLDAVAAPAIRRISVRSGHGVGKSTAVAMAAIWHVLMRVPSKTVVTAPTSAQLFDACFAEMKNVAKRLKPPFNDLLEVKSDRIELKSSPESTFISVRTSRAEQPEALAGVHSENVLLIADEASGVPNAVFEAASGSMSGHNATTVLTGNPTRNTGFFYDTHNRLKSDWYTMHVSCVTSPRVADDFVEDMKKRYGEDSPAYHVRVLGNFPPSEEDTVIPVALIEHAMANTIKIHEDTAAVWGLDVARQGGDSSVLAKRQGPVIHPVTVWRNLDLMQLTGAVKAEYDALPPSKRPSEIIVDSNGFGAGVLDRLRELGLPARGLNVSERAMAKDTYLNLRAELWFKCKAWLEGMDVSLPRDDALWAELAAPRYFFTSSGKLQVESKEAMKKRGVASPDRADAVCLTLANDHTTMAYGVSASGGWQKPLRRGIRGIV